MNDIMYPTEWPSEHVGGTREMFTSSGKLGSGVDRVVYPAGSRWVVKMAKHYAGQMSNVEESILSRIQDVARETDATDWPTDGLARVLACHPEGEWSVQERADNMPSSDDYSERYRDEAHAIAGRWGVADMHRGNWGISATTGEVVLIDYGTGYRGSVNAIEAIEASRQELAELLGVPYAPRFASPEPNSDRPCSCGCADGPPPPPPTPVVCPCGCGAFQSTPFPRPSPTPLPSPTPATPSPRCLVCDAGRAWVVCSRSRGCPACDDHWAHVTPASPTPPAATPLPDASPDWHVGR